MDMQGRIFTWGFGGYGRLGHNGPKDEPVPCSVKIFDIPNRGAKKIWAGATYSMAINEQGILIGVFCYATASIATDRRDWRKFVVTCSAAKV